MSKALLMNIKSNIKDISYMCVMGVDVDIPACIGDGKELGLEPCSKGFVRSGF